MKEEKTIVKQGGKYKEITYLFDGLKPGHPIGLSERELSDQEIANLVESKKPKEIYVNLLKESTAILFPYYRILKSWLKENPIANIVFTKESTLINHETLDMMKEIVEDDIDDENSALYKSDAGNKILELLEILRGKLRKR